MRRDPSVLDLFVRDWIGMGQPLDLGDPALAPETPAAPSVPAAPPSPILRPSLRPKSSPKRKAGRRIGRVDAALTPAERKELGRVAMVADFGRRSFSRKEVTAFTAGRLEGSPAVWRRLKARKLVVETGQFPFLELTAKGRKLLKG